MDIVLKRSGGVGLRDQLVMQLELKILGGDLAPGEKLPSVRALARVLKIHHNTVSAAYQDLESNGHLKLVRGSGVYVGRGAPSTLPEARGLDEMIQVALHAAFRRGHSGLEIRAAVERWLAAVPPDRVLVIDVSREMGELMSHELREALGVKATSCSIADLRADPGRLSGTLGLVLPYHVQTVLDAVPGASLEVVHVEPAPEDRAVVAALPAGSMVLVVTHSPTVVPFASVLLHSMRGDEVLIEARPVSEPRQWKRLIAAADLVMADALSVDRVRAAAPRRLHQFRVLPPTTLQRVAAALTIVVPR